MRTTKPLRKLIVEEKEITNHKEISKSIRTFYETPFKRKFSKTNVENQRFLNFLSKKTLTNEQYDLCENKLSETHLFHSIKSMKNNKIKSINQAFHTKILTIFQRQAVIKLIEKNDEDKRYIKNWKPISLLNVDTSILSKAI